MAVPGKIKYFQVLETELSGKTVYVDKQTVGSMLLIHRKEVCICIRY